MAKQDPVISKYLPEYSEIRPYNRNFPFNVINSVKQEFFPRNIRDAMRLRKEKHIQKTMNEVEIAPDFLDLIINSNNLPPKKNGRGISYLKVNAKPKNKRKRDQMSNQVPELTYTLRESQVTLIQNPAKRFKGNNFDQRE